MDRVLLVSAPVGFRIKRACSLWSCLGAGMSGRVCSERAAKDSENHTSLTPRPLRRPQLLLHTTSSVFSLRLTRQTYLSLFFLWEHRLGDSR